MEIERANKAINDKHDVTYLFKEQKAINADQAEELKMQKRNKQDIGNRKPKIKKPKKDQQLNAMAVFFVLILGKVIN